MNWEKKKKSIWIIWSWFAWLSAAITAAQKWYKVKIYEQHKQVWGRARVIEKDGFRWDMWPSWYLMPDLFERVFSWRWVKSLQETLQLQLLNPSYRVWRYESWQSTDIKVGRKENRDFFESLEVWSADKIKEYLEEAAIRYRIAIDKLLSIPFGSMRQLLKNAKDVLRVNPFWSLRKETHLAVKDIRLKSLLEYTMVFIGTAPLDAPAMYSMMAHVDFGLWVWYPAWGINSIIQLMKKLALDAWVEIKTGTPISEILIESGKAVGLRSGTEIYTHDNIISNADLPYTETQLIFEKKYQTYPLSYWKEKMLAPSTFLLYLWVEWSLEKFDHHNLIFREQRDEGFTEIFGNKHTELPQHPSIYLCCPSVSDTTVAPEGHSNLFVLVPAPVHVYPNKQEEDLYTKKLIEVIEKVTGEKFSDRIISKEVFHARHFREQYNSFWWTALWLAHTLRQSAYRRPYLKSKKVKNVFYCWWRTQPGIGMPMCLMSGKMVIDLLDQEES